MTNKQNWSSCGSARTSGPRFRHRVEAIVEAFSSMQEDLDKERKAIMKQWAKREQWIERVMG